MTYTQLKSLLLSLFIKSHVDGLPLHPAHSLDADASCLEAIELMNAHKIGCVLVRKGSDPLAGIFTERDVINKVCQDKRTLQDIPLHEMMTPSPQHLKYHASVAKAVYLMDTGGFRHIPVIARDNSSNMISVSDFVRFVAQKVGRILEKHGSEEQLEGVGDRLTEFFAGELSILKPTPPLFVHKDTSVGEAVRVMAKNRTGSVIIGIPEKKSVQGIFTERDVINKTIAAWQTAQGEPVEKFMTPSPVTLQPTTSVMYAFNAMNEGRFKHIPIVDFEERAIGMISSKNFIRFISTHLLNELQSSSK